MKKTAPKPPKRLSPEARRWWRRLVGEYALDDGAGELVLEMALRAFMRAEQARAVLDKDGCVTTDGKGRPKAHPAAQVERDSRAGMLSALKALNLDIEPLRDRVGRPGGK